MIRPLRCPFFIGAIPKGSARGVGISARTRFAAPKSTLLLGMTLILEAFR